MDPKPEPRPVYPFADFVRDHNVGGDVPLIEYEHVRDTLVPVCQRVLDGELKRVIFMLAPRYFKSEVASRLLPACFLKNNPDRKVGLVSYGAQLAWELSEEARNYYLSAKGRVSSDTAAKRRWRVLGDDGSPAGEMWADGVGGSLLGRGYHLGIIDDPQDPLQAHSVTYQKRFRDWYPSKFLSRQEPDAAIVFIMQRLGPGDAIEFLFEREQESPENWYVVCLDEIKSSEPLWHGRGEMGIPETCTLHKDDRKVGQVLSPKRFSLEEVEKLQRSAGQYTAKAQRQQRPTALAGDFWKAEWFPIHDEMPFEAHNGGKGWDTAYTDNDRNSASAFIESYRGPGSDSEFIIYIEDVDWAWLEFPDLITWMKAIRGPHYIEAKAAGKSAAQSLKREGVMASEVSVNGGSKLVRSSDVQPIVANRRISVNRRIYKKLLLGEHEDFKRSGRQGLLAVTAEGLSEEIGDLDVNDAFVQEINRHLHHASHDWSKARGFYGRRR